MIENIMNPDEAIKYSEAQMKPLVSSLVAQFAPLLGEDVAKWYSNRVCSHIACVVIAGERIGVKKEQISNHDLSKLTKKEFVPYAEYFWAVERGCKNLSKSKKPAFDMAWLNHIHNNPHHWQYWILPHRRHVLRMPDEYVLEMVADWLGAGLVYSGSWDIEPWVKENMPNMAIHPESLDVCKEILVRNNICSNFDN